MKDINKIEIHHVLALRREIAVIWSIEDVQDQRPDLTDDQAWQVLQQAWRQMDANWGITWFSLGVVAHDLFGLPSDSEA